jgi:hypothetical protein
VENINRINTKALILSLIKDDLTHNRLMYGLYKLGLDTDEYALGLCDTIFMLMEIKPTDDNYDFYVRLTEGVELITSRNQKAELNKLALAIYNGLLERK